MDTSCQPDLSSLILNFHCSYPSPSHWGISALGAVRWDEPTTTLSPRCSWPSLCGSWSDALAGAWQTLGLESLSGCCSTQHPLRSTDVFLHSGSGVSCPSCLCRFDPPLSHLLISFEEDTLWVMSCETWAKEKVWIAPPFPGLGSLSSLSLWVATFPSDLSWVLVIHLHPPYLS